MLNDASGFSKIYLALGRTDLRRGIDGLAGIVKTAVYAYRTGGESERRPVCNLSSA